MAKTGIILLGADGRMGCTIANLLKDNADCFLACAVERPERLENLKNLSCPVTDNLPKAIELAPEAVIVDFTAPDASLEAASIAAACHSPIVIGSTGFGAEQKAQLEKYALAAPLLWSANMSIGVNALKELLPLLVKALGPAYDIEMMEIHHKHKKDAPSGTALMLAEGMARARGQNLRDVRRDCRSGIIGPRKDGEIGIQAIRGGEVVGEHTIWFFGPSETLEITHRAASRENFAQGALRAAAWLGKMPAGRVYDMRDVLGINL